VSDDRVVLRMPQLGNGIETAVIEEWLVDVDEAVEQGEPVVVVESDKASSELEAPVTGTLAAVLAPDGVEVEIGQALAEFAPAPEAAS
jgi:pyruvate/2-oxoglutarate dehydrogenase complex dihydrolipoamide acyltransferase (E2) component